MKRIALLLAAMIIILPYGYAHAGYVDNLRADIDRILKPISGKVTSVGKKYILIDKGSSDGIKPGAVVSIFRNYGRYRYQGKTVALKKLVCYAVVEKTGINSSEVKPVYGVDEKKHRILYLIPDGLKYKNLKPETGDLFSINSGRQKVAILTRNPVIYDSIKTLLPNLDFADKDWVDLNRVDLKIYGENWSRLPKLAFKLGIDYFFVPKLIKTKGKAHLDIAVIPGMSGKKIAEVSADLSAEQYAKLRNRIRKSAALINPDNITASNLDLQYRQSIWDKILGKVGISIHHGGYQMNISGLNEIAVFRVSDVATDLAITADNNDGYRIAIVSDGSALIYSYRNGNIKRIQKLSPINAVYADLSGKLLIISGFNNYGAIKSVFYRLDKSTRRFVKVSSSGMWMRFVRWKGKRVVAASPGKVDRPFGDKLYLYEIQSNKLTRFADVSYILRKTSFFNWDTFNDANGQFLIYLSKDGNITVEKNGKIIKRTEAVFGFGKNSVLRYAQQQTADNPDGGVVKLSRAVKFFHSNGMLKVAAFRNYRTAVLNSFMSNPSNGSAFMVYDFDGSLHREYSSGNIYGRISAISASEDMFVIARAIPSDFLKRLWSGEKERGVVTLDVMENR